MSTRVETHCFSKQERKVQPLLNGPLHQDKVPSPGIPTKGTTIFLFSEILFFRCFFFFFLIWLLWVFIAAGGFLQLQWAGLLSLCGAWASLCSGFSLQSMGSKGSRFQYLQLEGSRAQAEELVVHELSYPEACGIFPDEGSNPRPLHWQADS